MRIKTTLGFLTPGRLAKIKRKKDIKCWRGCGEIECLCADGGNADSCNHYGKQRGELKKLRINLPYSQRTPPTVEIETCPSTFAAGLSTIANKWKQPNCFSTDENVVHLPNGVLLIGKEMK